MNFIKGKGIEDLCTSYLFNAIAENDEEENT